MFLCNEEQACFQSILFCKKENHTWYPLICYAAMNGGLYSYRRLMSSEQEIEFGLNIKVERNALLSFIDNYLILTRYISKGHPNYGQICISALNPINFIARCKDYHYRVAPKQKLPSR